MHITKSAEQITPFGGLNFCLDHYHQSGLAELIDRHLGPRGANAAFGYSDIIANQLAVLLSGGDCAEDLGEHLSGPLAGIKGLSVCSPDTLLRGIKELSCVSRKVRHPSSGVAHTFNINAPLNDLLLKALRMTGQLSRDTAYTLDYDNQIIATAKWDAARSYKSCYGYQPGVASIEGLPVYVEGRNGNSQASFEQAATLRRLFERLTANGVSVGCFRADAASYGREVLEVVQAYTERFYIRARRSAAMDRRIGRIPEAQWQRVVLAGQPMQVAETRWAPFDGSTTYRLIVTRIKRSDRQGDLFGGGAYIWRAILSNDWSGSAEQIVTFYNKRGASERLFDVMNNDFGWAGLPCSFLAENTAYMILTALLHNFYRYLIGRYAERLSWLRPTYRLKKFIFRFISVPAKWIRSGRRSILKLYTCQDYEVLLE